MTNKLQEINTILDKKTKEKIIELRNKRKKLGYIDFDSYKINKLKKSFFEVLKNFDESVQNIDDIEIAFVDRKKFDADISIKLKALLTKYKKEYVKEVVPKLLDFLVKSNLSNIIKKIDSIGIYLNISLKDNFLFENIKEVFEKNNRFGENNLQAGKDIVVDYSSPNVAKHLHAGHIRSTIIGHVLANIYEKNAYTVHRVNHINDWGGFGYLIEGYLRWKEKLNHFENKNDMLFYIYTIYRTGEKAYKNEKEFDLKNEKLNFFGDFENYDNFKEKFENFLEESKQRFKELENGKENIVDLWQEMVSWSLDDFEVFYNLLDIHHDYTLGESFYAKAGTDLVFELQKENKVVIYTEDLAKKDLEILKQKLDNEEIDEKYFEKLKEEIKRDIGAYIIYLNPEERFVVLKSDKSSIYATRDLAAIKYRSQNYNPDKIIYEVGQEQAEHFDKLFKSAKKIGIENVEFKHIYHGFYVDAKTKKKLSSRDGASNVIKLIKESIKYFENKYKDNKDFTQEEIKDIAYKLAIGSIIFNDIKQDKKNPVSISSNLQETFKNFEESGGAYIMYSIARANSILKKINNLEENFKLNENLENIEKQILSEIMKFPLIINQASENHNPALITEFALNLARYYNSYYNAFRVIENGKIITKRALITKAVKQVLINAMEICHIKVVDKI